MNLEKLTVHYVTSKVLMCVQHVQELALRSLRVQDSSLLGCAAIKHVVLSHSCILCNTQFYQIHTNCAVRSPITFMYTLQYTVLTNSHTVLYAVLSLSHLNRHQHPSSSRLLNVYNLTRETYLQFCVHRFRCTAHNLKQKNSKQVVATITSHIKKPVVNPWKFHRINSIPKFHLKNKSQISKYQNYLHIILSVYWNTTKPSLQIQNSGLQEI